MIILTIDNSESKIEGIGRDQHRSLSKILSYTLNPTATYFSGRPPRRISLLTKTGTFPTGLLPYVTTFLKDQQYQQVDTRIIPPQDRRASIKAALGHTPYPEQTNAALACLRAHRGIVVAPTGVGKSVIAALIIEKLQVSTLIIVPSLELKRQLTDSLTKIFGEDLVGHNKWIAVYNVDSVKCTRTYSCVIIDEFHHAAAKTYRKLNKTTLARTYYRFGLTATPFRSQSEERLLLESVLSEVIYKVDYKDAVKSGYIVPMEAYFYEVPRTKTTGTRWAGVYSELCVRNDTRNRIIADLLVNLKNSGKSVLCLVKEIAHGDILSQAASIHFANGLNEDTEILIKAFASDKIKALIGTTGVLGEGVDTKPCEFVIIAGLGKSRNAFMQQVGRAFRKWPGKESCKVIIFSDKSHKWTRNHYREQCKILSEEYGITPIQLDL